MDWLEWGYWGLFLASFLSATVLPFSSEAVLAGLLYGGGDPVLSVSVATLGNWLGGMSTYWIGHLGKWEWIEKYLRVEQDKVIEWRPKIDRYGSFFAVLSFLPIIGDVIALALGFFRSNIWLTGFWMFVGKLARYLVVYGGMLAV
ncbi:MAG: DedA family protein [Flavobacteriales bacterium]|jgi:membrane protein YqaA with SNARE-associated domain|nr:DedA family protein [Flavobacteriales bacterium]MCF8459274.1 DedA family protein [Flavobacteriales bacterium]